MYWAGEVILKVVPMFITAANYLLNERVCTEISLSLSLCVCILGGREVILKVVPMFITSYKESSVILCSNAIK